MRLFHAKMYFESVKPYFRCYLRTYFFGISKHISAESEKGFCVGNGVVT